MGIIVLPVNEHAIAKGKETVLLFDGFLVAMQRPFPPHEGGDEHHEGALGQMEIGDEGVHRFIGEARLDEI
jgi:hypothetical protein